MLRLANAELAPASDVLEDFFENGAVALHLVGSDGTILRANKAELALLGYEASEYIGRNISEFHADADSIRGILSRLASGEKLDRFPARLRTKNDSVKYVEITSSVQFKDGRFLNTRCFTMDVTELRKAEEALKNREQMLNQILNGLPAAVYMTDKSGTITYFNPAAEALAGKTPIVGVDKWCVTWRLRNVDGTPLAHEECPMAVALREKRPIRDSEAFAERPDGSLIPFVPYPTPLYDESGEMVGAVNMLIDISDQKRREAQIEFMMRELSHRSKNLLTVVRAMASRIAKHSKSLFDFDERFAARIQAMARSHDLLVETEWSGADIRTIIEKELSAFVDDTQKARIDFKGEPTSLSPNVAQNLALAIHELATNAVKYGALSDDEGRIEISWSVPDDTHTVQFEWNERTSKRKTHAKRRGFGTLILNSFFTAPDLRLTQTGLHFSGQLSFAKKIVAETKGFVPSLGLSDTTRSTVGIGQQSRL